MIREKEAIELKNLKQDTRTASKQRIQEFIDRVNNEIVENKEVLEQKRKIQKLKEEIEFQKLRNRSISKGKLSKERENHLLHKMNAYEHQKWLNRENKIRIKEKKMEEELKTYFKPQVSKSSKRLASRKRNKQSCVVTGGKSISKQELANKMNNDV